MRSRKLPSRGAVISAAAAVIMSPLMAASFALVTPSAEDCIVFAADASARLAAGKIPPSETPVPVEPEITDTPEDKPTVTYPYISFDDSYMLSFGELEIPSSDNEEISVPEDSAEAVPYPEAFDGWGGSITRMTYGYMNGTDYIDLPEGGQIRNVTSLSRELLSEECLKPYDFSVTRSSEPQVLIMHTHETESFEPYQRDFYDSSFSSRTTDDSMNMAAVGEAIAEKLEAAGIGVIHDTTKHDYPSYNGSYDRSRETVAAILEEYPSIKVVLDIHRDAIERADGTRIAPAVEINGKSAAQLMIICGCDDGTMNMPDYMKNYHFAAALQQQFEKDYPGLTRPVLFDYRKYNQDMTTGSLLIEVGGHANSIDEAIYSGELIGDSLVNLFTEE